MKMRAEGQEGLGLKGIVEHLRKADPGGVAELNDRGGRLGGEVMGRATKKHSPNGSLITALRKVSRGY